MYQSFWLFYKGNPGGHGFSFAVSSFGTPDQEKANRKVRAESGYKERQIDDVTYYAIKGK